MHIVHVGPRYQPVDVLDGVTGAVAGYATAQAALGHRVTVLHFAEGGPNEERVDPETGVRELHVSVPRTRLRLGGPARRLFRDNAPRADVYHFHSAFIPRHAQAARVVPVPYVVSPHGAYLPPSLQRRRRAKRLFRRLIERRHLHDAGAIHALTGAEAAATASWARAELARIVIIPNAIAPVTPIDHAEREQARATLGLAADEPCLLFIGRGDVHAKGIDLLLSGLARLAGERPAGERAPRLLLAAVPHASSPSIAELVPPAIAEQVTLLGPVWGERRRTVLAAADLFVSPSRFEGFGGAPLEAIAHGVPTLVTDTTPAAELVAEFAAGEVVPPTVEGVASGIRAALDRRLMDAARAQAERERIATAMQQRLRPERIASELVEQLYAAAGVATPGATERARARASQQ